MVEGTTPAAGASGEVRVLHVGPDPAGRGGMAAVLRAISTSTLAASYRLDFVVTYRTAARIQRMFVFARALAALARWCLGPGRRLVHVHTTVRGSLYRKSVCVLLARALRRPVILHVHSGVGDIQTFDEGLAPAGRALVRRALRAADRVLSVSAAGAREFQRRYGRDGIEVVPNAAPAVREREGAGEAGSEGVRLVYLGGFANPVKGGSVLVDALPALLGAGGIARLVLAGPGDPPPSVVALAAEDPRLRWMGWLDEDAKLTALEQADVFLLPSTSEGLPVALLEAMAHGCAIAASRAGGIGEVLTDGEDAILVPAGDPAALAAAAAALVEDPGLRDRFGRSARARAERLNEVEVWGRLDAIYGELSGRTRATSATVPE